jgi:hypothetical protein
LAERKQFLDYQWDTETACGEKGSSSLMSSFTDE